MYKQVIYDLILFEIMLQLYSISLVGSGSPVAEWVQILPLPGTGVMHITMEITMIVAGDHSKGLTTGESHQLGKRSNFM